MKDRSVLRSRAQSVLDDPNSNAYARTEAKKALAKIGWLEKAARREM
jgi:hypothetical protein